MSFRELTEWTAHTAYQVFNQSQIRGTKRGVDTTHKITSDSLGQVVIFFNTQHHQSVIHLTHQPFKVLKDDFSKVMFIINTPHNVCAVRGGCAVLRWIFRTVEGIQWVRWIYTMITVEGAQ